jgi:hypothetical protein
VIWIITTHPDTNEFYLGFWITTILLSSYGFSTTVFYFTIIRFRIVVLFLIGIAPFLLQSSKTDKEITLSFIIFLVLFFLLIVERTRQKSGDETKLAFVSDRWYIAAMLLFAAITLAVSYIAPKPYRIPKIAYLDTVINQTVQPFGIAIRNAVQNQNPDLMQFNPIFFKSESQINAVTAPLGERVLFEVKASEPLYFRIQTWDVYNKNRWANGEKLLDIGQPVENLAKRQMNLGVIVPLLDKLNGDFNVPSKISKFSGALNYTSVPNKVNEALITTKGVQMISFLHPPGIINLEMSKNPQQAYLNEKLYCYSKRGLSINESYNIEYVSKEETPLSREFQIIKNLDKETAEFLLNPDNYIKGGTIGKNQVFVSAEERSVLIASKEEMDVAYKNFTNLPGNLPKRVYDLANSITLGKTGDFEKASAIEQFFHTSGFKYSLEPARLPSGMDYNDFFIFESRKGVCVHFASAMVILARACGLPARYVEGYVADEKDRKSGCYLIREKDAHAFPEVYIAGYGWMVFEPTVSIQDSNNEFYKFLADVGRNVKNFIVLAAGFINKLPVWVKTLFIPVIAFLILTMIWFFFRTRENRWRKRILKTNKRKSLEEIFKRITLLLKRIDFDIKKHETPSCYSVRISEGVGLELSYLSDVFNRSKYGGIEPSIEDVENAVEIYDETRTMVRKRLGFIKSWMI